MSSSLGAHWTIAFDIEHNRWPVVNINTKVALTDSIKTIRVRCKKKREKKLTSVSFMYRVIYLTGPPPKNHKF